MSDSSLSRQRNHGWRFGFGTVGGNTAERAEAPPFATGVLVAPDKAGSLYDYGQVPQSVIDKVKRIEAVCRAHGVPVGTAALQFPLRNPNVVTVTCGVQSEQQAVTNYEWASRDIPAALWDDLAAIGVE